VLEALDKVDNVILDKTGTVTEGVFSLLHAETTSWCGRLARSPAGVPSLRSGPALPAPERGRDAAATAGETPAPHSGRDEALHVVASL